MTHILTSHTAKQFLGAIAGMAIAGVLYFGIDQASDFTIKGLLVSTDTVPENANISINAKNVNDATLRRIAMRAQTVATTLENSTVPSQAETPVTNFASSRRAVRFFEAQRKELAATAKTYSNNPNVVMSEEDRLAIRAARIAGLPTPDKAPQPISASTVSLSAPSDVSSTSEPVVTLHNEPYKPAAMTQVTSSHDARLPNSGLGLSLLVLTALAVTIVMAKTTWRAQLTSMMYRLRIG